MYSVFKVPEKASGEVPPYINPPTQVLKPTKKCKNNYFWTEKTKNRTEKSRKDTGWHRFGLFQKSKYANCLVGTSQKRNVKCAILGGKDAVLQDWCAIGVNWCILDENGRGFGRQKCLKSP